MRCTTVDANGTASFVTDGNVPPVEGCVTDAKSLELQLDSTAPPFGDQRERALHGLANNDERSADSYYRLAKSQVLVS